MTYFLDSVCTIVGIFHKYAQRQGGSITLNRREMRMLIQKEFAEVLKNPCDPQTVEFTFQLLDVNGDSLVDFNEYLIFIFQIAKACYSYLQPREYLLQEEGSRALHEGEPGGSKRDHWQLQDEEREEDYVHERRGSDWIPLHLTEDSRRGELGKCYLPSEPVEEEEEEEEEEERNFQGRDRELRDGDRRIRPSQEHQERETERRRLEPKQQEDIETPERHQLRQREPALEEGSPRQSRRRRNDNDRRQADELLDGDEQDLYPPIVTSRRDDGRQRRGRETEHREAEGRLFRCGSKARVDQGNHRAEYNSERSRASREPRELEDGRRDLETHDELRTRAFEPRVADERREQIRNRRPGDDYEEHRPLPREGERRSQAHETEHRESERRRREHSAFQSRDDVHRANWMEEEEVRGSERRHNEDEWSRPRRREALRRPEVEDLEHRERERRRSYSPELENMDRRSQPHESEGGEEVRRSRHREDDEQRRQQSNREETRATESRRRRPRSHEPEPRDPKYGRSQRYEEEPKRDDQRRQHNYEVQSPERDVARRRRLQTRESAEREDNQERQQYYERESRDSEGDKRRPQLCYSEPREGEKRRHQLTDSRVDERERLQSRESVTRPTQRDRFSPSDSSGEYDWSRQQIYESRDIEQREGRRRNDDRRSCGQRQIQGIDIDQREGEGQRRTNAEARDVDQRQAQTRGVDHGESEQQRRTSSRDSGDKDIDQRRTQTDEASSRDGEDQRRTSSHDSNTRQVNQKMMQTSDPDFRDTEIPQHNKGNSPPPREVTSLSNQTGDREFAEDLLRDQRPPESGESQLSRKPRQHKAEQSQSIPRTLEQKQATRGSQCLSGPELRGPQRRWLQSHQTEAQEGEAGVEQTQLKVGLPESKRATSQPGERQTTEGQESRVQRHHPKPATQAEGESELSLAGKGGKAQEPAAVKQRQLQAQGASYEEGPQPEVEEPKVEEDDESGPRAQESQPPLEDDDQQAVTEKPCDSLGESKLSVVCNPLYEYLLAQKKQEQP